MPHAPEQPLAAAADRRATGAFAEAFARRALLDAGLTSIAANRGFRMGELDLVMRERDTIVFVEVRFRAASAFGGAPASVDRGKRRRLARAAMLFLAHHPRLAQQPCRFDVVALSGDPAAPHMDWIRNAFTLDDI